MKRQKQFETIRSEGGLLPADLLLRVLEADKDLGGLRGEDYGLPPNEQLNEAIVRSWNRLVGAWGSFQEARARLANDDPGTSVTRERWLLVLLQEFGYGRVQTANAVVIDGKSYAVSHAWAPSPVPIHLVGCKVKLDTRSRGVAGAATQSPHGTVQELLNRSNERLWGIVSNGLQLRLLRDNSSLTRQAYVEFDLEAMLDGEAYADFALLWLVCHASRVEGEPPHDCWLEKWSQEAARQGTRALDGLRNGVETAITTLGAGFLQSGSNLQLKDALRSGELTTHDYYRQLLRLVYRLLFLFVAEDRQLVHDPAASDETRARYAQWYSTARLRDLAGKRRGTKHGDLWSALKLVMGGLGNDDGLKALGLPALGSYLWSEQAIEHLDGSTLANRSLLEAVRALATVRDGAVLRTVDYKNLGAEELGSVYESLLELHPQLDADAGTFALSSAAGNERKTTGSYYTPSSLIACLLDSVLDPVLAEATQKGEEAILDLKICDPACGSGHFLVAAAHRIAKQLASARTGDEEPSPEATRRALRDVVSRCIYGVDINPMAVELCKVSLWMEALDPGRPLSFLDAHIKCGNSLLGATPALSAGGIPDDAFNPLAGDEKALVTELRKRNRRERAGQLTLEDAVAKVESELRKRALGVEGSADTSSEDLRAKEESYRQLVESPPYERARLLADAWCGAFVQRKTAGAPQITQAALRLAAEAPAPLAQETRAEIDALRMEYAFFQWHVEFPQVFRVPEQGEPENDQTGWSGGFDCVIGNPPWERLKLQEKEFFASQPEIANARNAAQRKRLIAGLDEVDPDLLAAWLMAIRKSEAESHFIRSTGAYPLCGRGDVNTYSIFAELMLRIVSKDGRAGFLSPTGIATDHTTRDFFSFLVSNDRLVSLFDFKNHDGLFYDVGHRRFKFCILTLAGPAGSPKPPQFAFSLHMPSDLAIAERRFPLTREDFALINPNTLTCPVFRSERDASITRGVYHRVPVLVRDSAEDTSDTWSVRLREMIHMANDSEAFRTSEELSAAGFRLEGAVFTNAEQKYVPLYESKLFYFFNHRYGDYSARASGSRDTELPRVAPEDLNDPTFAPRPQYWILERFVDQASEERWNHRWFLCYRKITFNANERTFIACVIPHYGVSNSAITAFPARRPILGLLANLCAIVFDYVVRQKLGGANMVHFITKQLPVLPPSAYAGVTPWANDLDLNEWLSPRVLELAYTANDLRAFAEDHGYYGAAFRWDEERRFKLRCELDAAFFQLYGLARDDVDYVMDTFPIVCRRDEQAYGEYRSKRLILEIYDELAVAIASGRPYHTHLDPPPADPRVAHPPRSDSLALPTAGER